MVRFATAFILAGGKGSRMGFDKQFMEIDNIKVIDRLSSLLEKIFDEIIIISNKPEEYGDYKYQVVADIIKEKGPLAGIHTGLSFAKSDYSFVMACDMPNLDLDYIAYMKERLGQRDFQACLTRTKSGIEPFHGFYSKSLIGPIEDYLGQDRRSIHRFLEALDVLYIDQDQVENSFRKDIFVNLNTPEDLENYIKK